MSSSRLVRARTGKEGLISRKGEAAVGWVSSLLRCTHRGRLGISRCDVRGRQGYRERGVKIVSLQTDYNPPVAFKRQGVYPNLDEERRGRVTTRKGKKQE